LHAVAAALRYNGSWNQHLAIKHVDIKHVDFAENYYMAAGKLLAISIAPTSGAPMEEADTIEAIAGQGLAGDRYGAGRAKSIRGSVQPEQHVTLIESEAIAAVNANRKDQVTHRITRRNLLTEGVKLADFIGQRFRIGDIQLQGIEPCTPCGYLEKLTQVDGIKEALQPCGGGLRAAILSGGVLRTGDAIELCATTDGSTEEEYVDGKP